jgi:hypothetical protein
MRAMKGLAVLAVMVVASGCVMGKSASDFRLAKSPNGAKVYLMVPSGDLEGELLEVKPDAVILKKADGQIVLAKFLSIARIAAAEFGKDYVASGEELSRGKSERYRVISHFPRGMSDAIRSRLLSEAGQSAVVVVQ